MEAKKPEPFLYRPLRTDRPQARLLCVEDPGDDLTLVRCRFETIDLPDDGEGVPSYEAASYFSGSSTECRDVEVDGQLLSVPINTAKALSWLCHHHGHRRVWIDAICINQQDIVEKNQQVARMRWVYLHAKRVFIWLGDLQNGGVSPLAKINNSAALAKPQLIPNWNSPEVQLELADFTYLSQILDKIDKQIDWSAVTELLSIDWFHRMWVMQEAWLALEAIYFHHSSMSVWKNVALICLLLLAKARRTKTARLTNMSLFYTVIRPRETQSKGESLRLLLTSSLGLSCGHSHDSVYALLGLRRPETQLPHSPSLVNVDYSRPVLEVYAEATRACIVEDGSLFCLDAILNRHWGLGKYPDEGAPSSWVLPLDGDRQSRVMLDPLQSSAFADTTTYINHATDTLVLELGGVIADRVAHVISRPDLPSSARDPIVEARYPWIRQLMDAMDIAQHHFKLCKDLLPTWSDSELLSGFAELWSTDRRLHQLFPDDITSEAFRSKWRELFANLLSSKFLLSIITAFTGASPASDSLVSTIRDVSNCVQAVESLSHNFDIFVTRAGQMGIGPKSLAVGDEVCIIFGEGLPVLLRPNGKEWVWVGLSFLGSIAQGGLIRDMRTRRVIELETKTFVIR